MRGLDNGDSKVPGLELSAKGEILNFDFEAQVHAVFANVKTILEASGSSWEELIDIHRVSCKYVQGFF